MKKKPLFHSQIPGFSQSESKTQWTYLVSCEKYFSEFVTFTSSVFSNSINHTTKKFIFFQFFDSGGCGRSCYTLVLFLLRFTPTFTISNCVTSSEMKNNVIITSLLNLHDESTNCARVNLRGLQQRAIIEKTVSEINSNLMFSEAMRLCKLNSCYLSSHTFILLF